MHTPSLFFDRFELQPAQQRMLRDGQPVTLRARAFDLLLVLAEHSGSLLTKSELLDRVWPGLVVEENNVAAQIASLRKTLGGDFIATVPGRGYRFTAAVRHAADATVAAPRIAAPAPAAAAPHRLFGRQDDLAALESALHAGGCVTLVGAGGVGKTVLARLGAARWAADHTAWVDLAALNDGTQLTGALCRALGMSTSGAPDDVHAACARKLAAGPWLLVLDNAEHVVDAVVALVGTLRATAPSLSILVTSQLPLRIACERVQPLDPLALPQEGLPDDEAMSTPAVQLLAERIRAVDRRFPIGPEAVPLLRRLCTRLDGLPLALEMAAALVPTAGLRGVLAALDQRFAALRRGARDAPQRHKTLHAALAWSHGLLPPAEQRMFRRLGVFASGFSLDLAVAVASEPGEDRWDAIDLLAQLVDRSLVTSLHTDPPRYRLLETMRSFALEQLDASGEADALRLKAATALAELMAGDGAREPRAASANELANVPELAAWAREHAPAAALELTLRASDAAIWTPWLGEAAHWVDACEPLLGGDLPPALQARWWRELARFQSFVRGPRAVEAARNACAIERRLGNASGLFWSLIPLLRSRVLANDEFEAARREAQSLLDAHPDWPARERVVFSGSLAMEYRRRGDFESAWLHQQDEADQAERAGLQQIADNARSNLVATLIGLRRYAEALTRVDALLAGSGEVQSPVGAHNRVQRLNALIGLGRLDDAQAHAAETLEWCRRYDLIDIFPVLAVLAVRQGRAPAAVMLVGHQKQRLMQRGAELPTDSHAPWREALQLAARTLDAATLEGLMERGARLSDAAAGQLLFDASGPD